MAIEPVRIAITGMGIVSPLGDDLETLWANLSTGKSGVAPIELTPTDSLPFRSGGEARGFDGKIDCYGDLDKKLQRSIKKNMKVMCREIEMGVAASQKALIHCGLGPDRDAERCGCLFGCDYILTRPEEFVDGVESCISESGKFDVSDWPNQGLYKVEPLWLLKYLPNMPNSHVSIYNDFRGPNNSITVREASMNLAIAESSSIIRRGAADVMIVGATGSRIHPLRMSHMTNIEKLATEKDDPAAMARPFDAAADGMVLGEGAGALVLESWDHAQARGAKIWGEVIGEGAAMIGPKGDRDFLRMAVAASIKSAIASAGERLPKQWHLHAQGYSVPEIDKSESLAIADALATFPDVPVACTKSYTGNLGAASGALELISSVLAMQHGQLFPIRNLDSAADHVTWQPATSQSAPGTACLHSSFSQQGQAASIVVAAA
ncbi:MAG TPA: 3-oxoacyl-ACP synthase [Planctomycetaceae bacterium]|nr:3-oxoacyl-ACP synthase [Planctomycetaceae bacterium]